MAYFRSRYCRKGIYFLDEPETALSPKTQLELLDILKENDLKGHAQFIIATHSPILLSMPGARIYGFDGARIKSIAYKETGHYNVYNKFFESLKTKNKKKKRRAR
jgi:predicted ATPase